MSRTYKQFMPPTGCAEKLAHWAMGDHHGFCFRGTGWGKHFAFDSSAFAGIGAVSDIIPFNEAAAFITTADDYVVTHLCYDLKNQLENLRSENPDRIGFPEFAAFIPFWTARLRETHLEIGWPAGKATETEADEVFRSICTTPLESPPLRVSNPSAGFSKTEYLGTIDQCQRHIRQGDIYQANICQEFSWQTEAMNAASLFNRGFAQNPNPFSVIYRFDDCYCICWSPERFLTFFGNTVLSQPMKGTAPRGKTEREDRAFFEQLRHSEKDRRENVMIVDMVRNDLSYFSTPGSVRVPELYTIETYPRVHQMHSTVTATLQSGTRLLDALLRAFPMGSMTGAPKIRAMEIIETLENTKRGLFSGTIGFVTPSGEADFNVVIRSLLYNMRLNTLSCHVGGGITALSDPSAEYEESLVKFAPIAELLETA